MSGWGNKDRQPPAFLPAHIRDRAFLTKRGWEIQPHGNDNPACSELLVAMGSPDMEIEETHVKEVVETIDLIITEDPILEETHEEEPIILKPDKKKRSRKKAD